MGRDTDGSDEGLPDGTWDEGHGEAAGVIIFGILLERCLSDWLRHDVSYAVARTDAEL